MSIKNGDMPAMPMFSSEAKPCQVRDSSTQSTLDVSGLTKREQFAVMAMQGMLSNKYVSEFSTEINDDSYDMPNGLANNAVRYADALLAQLEEKGDE